MTGCLDSYGNCRTVGERFYENCDTVECQIVNGSCYHLVILSKGKEKILIYVLLTRFYCVVVFYNSRTKSLINFILHNVGLKHISNNACK